MAAAAQLSKRPVFSIETKFGLTLLRIRTMTSETIVGQNWQDLPIEIDRLCRFFLRLGSIQEQPEP